RLADRGVAALFVKLPYYGERRPASGGLDAKRFLSADIERTVTAMRQGICDVRRAAAWLAAREEIDPRRLGVAGISLGGIVPSIRRSTKVRSSSQGATCRRSSGRCRKASRFEPAGSSPDIPWRS